jgi:hypothetical protein
MIKYGIYINYIFIIIYCIIFIYNNYKSNRRAQLIDLQNTTLSTTNQSLTVFAIILSIIILAQIPYLLALMIIISYNIKRGIKDE